MITEHTAWAQPTLVRMLDDRGRVKYKYGFRRFVKRLRKRWH